MFVGFLMCCVWLGVWCGDFWVGSGFMVLSVDELIQVLLFGILCCGRLGWVAAVAWGFCVYRFRCGSFYIYG